MTLPNLLFTINVIAGKKITGKGPKQFYDGGLVNGPMFCEYPETRIVNPGVFKRLDDIADAIKFAIEDRIKEGISQYQDLDKNYAERLIEDLDLRYISKLNNEERGETKSYGSYILRPLTDNEMSRLIRKVDSLIRPIVYKTQKKIKQ